MGRCHSAQDVLGAEGQAISLEGRFYCLPKIERSPVFVPHHTWLFWCWDRNVMRSKDGNQSKGLLFPLLTLKCRQYSNVFHPCVEVSFFDLDTCSEPACWHHSFRHPGEEQRWVLCTLHLSVFRPNQATDFEGWWVRGERCYDPLFYFPWGKKFVSTVISIQKNCIAPALLGDSMSSYLPEKH